MKGTFFLAAALAALSVSCLVGCGKSNDLGTVPVSGQIMLNGKPLVDADVYFMTEKFTGTAKTDEEGKYTLVRGAMPGENRIYISKVEIPDQSDMVSEEMDMAQIEAANAAVPSKSKQASSEIKQLVPEEFSDPEKSELTATVPDGGASGMDFHL